MINPRRSVPAAIVAILMVAASSASAGDLVGQSGVIETAARCASSGPDFVNLGNGLCGRIKTHARIEVPSLPSPSTTWATGGTSRATLRSDDTGMVPGAIGSRHLRVRGGLETYDPFR